MSRASVGRGYSVGMVLFDVCSFLFDGMAAPASESGPVALLRLVVCM